MSEKVNTPNKDVELSEQKEALCSLLPQLLISSDKLRFAVKQIRKKGTPSFIDDDELQELQIHYEESAAILSHLISSIYE